MNSPGQQANAAKETFNGTIFNGDNLQQTGLTLKNFQILYASGAAGPNGAASSVYDDFIAGQTDFKYVYLGNGQNLVDNLSGGVLPGATGPTAHWVNVDIGEGNSEVLGTTAPGSTITASGVDHRDIITISPDIRLVGLDRQDRLIYDGNVLTGGVAIISPLSKYYYDYAKGVKYGINGKGDLVVTPIWASVWSDVKSFFGYTSVDPSTYVANYQPYTDGATGTAGITLIAYKYEVLGIAGLLATPDASINGALQVANLMMKAFTGQTWDGVDPFIIDLTGQGLNISPLDSGSSQRFDVNGDGFANPSSWITSSEGLLVTVGADGQVSLVTSWAQLEAYDFGHTGVITDDDLALAAADDLPQLRIWVDANSDHVPNDDELLTLAQAGVASISLSATDDAPGTFVGDAQVLSTAGVTLTNGVTSSLSDVLFKVDESNSTWLGDDDVTTNAAALPDLKGYGTLQDLSVALSINERADNAAGTLAAGQQSALEIQVDDALVATSSLDELTPTLSLWRAGMDSVLEAWTATTTDPLPGTTADWWQRVTTLYPNLVAPTNSYSATGQSLTQFDAETGATQATDDIQSYAIVQTNADGSKTVLDGFTYQVVPVYGLVWVDGQQYDEQIGVQGEYVGETGGALVDVNGEPIYSPTFAQAQSTNLAADESLVSGDHFAEYVLAQNNSDGSQSALDVLYFVPTPGVLNSVGYWAFSSGRAVTDAKGDDIVDPTLAQAMAMQLPADDVWVVNGDVTGARGGSAANAEELFLYRDHQ